MKKIVFTKRFFIITAVISLVLLLVSSFLFYYFKGFDYKILNDTKKSTEEDTKKTNDDNDTDSTDTVEETIEAEEKENNSESTSESNSSNWWEYPDEILETERSGDDLLVLVTKKYKLPSSYAPSDLVKASEAGIRRGDGYYVREILINDLTDMVNDMEADGIDISIVSGYRSYTTQESTYQYWVNYNNGSTDEADKISARPGHSQHQLGTAIDFSTSEAGDVVGSSFTGTAAQLWLAENAYKYGFALSYPKGAEETTGYSYESWHYRYIGKEYAEEWWNSGMILDEWLETK